METEIFINQIGYRPLDRKTVFVSENQKGAEDSFTLCKCKDDSVVFKGNLIPAPQDSESGGSFFTGDFTSVKTAGKRYFFQP